MDVPKIHSGDGIRTEASVASPVDNVMSHIRDRQVGDEERVAQTLPVRQWAQIIFGEGGYGKTLRF